MSCCYPSHLELNFQCCIQTVKTCDNSKFTLFREGDKVTVKIGKSQAMEGIVVRQGGVDYPNFLVCIAGVFKKVLANQLSHAPL